MLPTEPVIDDRSYQEILNEALARIPVHNPEWTNYSDSDPGVTILQVFAFMTENLLYRANLVPERNRIKFLRLLGLPMKPAAAAEGLVLFDNTKGDFSVVSVEADEELLAGKVPFRTREGLYALPVEGRVYYKAFSSATGSDRTDTQDLYRQLNEELDDPSVNIELYETRRLLPPTPGAEPPVVDLENDTLDGALWLAILARKAEQVEDTRDMIANKTMTLGIVPALDAEGKALPASGRVTPDNVSNIRFERPDIRSTDTEPTPRYALLPSRPFADVLEEPGTVELQLPGSSRLLNWIWENPEDEGVGAFPPSLEDTDVADRVVTWIRIRAGERPSESDGDTPSKLRARFTFVGVNAARIEQKAVVAAEYVGDGTGEPNQVLTLVNTPVIKDSVVLTVNGERWTQTDDLLAAPPEVPKTAPGLSGSREAPRLNGSPKVYTLDRESGEVRFGDGLRGARPPRRAVIQASYAYGGGSEGVVGIGAVTKWARTRAGLKVNNPIPTWGGVPAETAEMAEGRIAGFLQHRDRCVTADDFAAIARETPAVRVGRVDVLPLFHPDGAPAEGVVTILVLPESDPLHPSSPRPDRLFLNAVCAYVNPRRLITTEVHVRGPEYVPVYVSVGIDVVPGRDSATVREAVKAELADFLSPLTGGFEGGGWPLNRDVDQTELFAVATRVAGVSKINSLLLGDSNGTAASTISIEGLQLPHLLAVSVQIGDPQPLDQLAGAAEVSDPTVVPVPFVPDVC